MRQVGHLQKLHEKYFDKGFRIIAISAEPASKIQSIVVEDKGATYWMGSDPGRETFAQFADGRVGIPHAYLVDAAGKVVGEGVPNEAQIEKLLEQAFDPALDRELHGMLKSAARQYEKGDVGKAWAKAARYVEHDDRTVVADAKYLREQCEAYAAWKKKMAEDAIASKDYATAIGDLETLEDDFDGMEAATWAEETLKKLESDDQVKTELKAQKAYAKAVAKERKAGRDKRKLRPAIIGYKRVVKKYPNTHAAAMAEKALNRLAG